MFISDMGLDEIINLLTEASQGLEDTEDNFVNGCFDELITKLNAKIIELRG